MGILVWAHQNQVRPLEKQPASKLTAGLADLEVSLPDHMDTAQVRIHLGQPGSVVVKFDPDTRPIVPTDALPDLAKVKTSFYQTNDEARRMRAAYVATQAAERRPSLSAFISGAVLLEVERLERDYNDGRPWPAVEAGEIPKGAPLQT